MLTTRWGRMTHFAAGGRCVQTDAASQFTKRAHARPPRRCASRHPQGARPEAGSALFRAARGVRRLVHADVRRAHAMTGEVRRAFFSGARAESSAVRPFCSARKRAGPCAQSSGLGWPSVEPCVRTFLVHEIAKKALRAEFEALHAKYLILAREPFGLAAKAQCLGRKAFCFARRANSSAHGYRNGQLEALNSGHPPQDSAPALQRHDLRA